MAFSPVERLEPRIAPATLGLSTDGKTFVFNDVNGDQVSVVVSKGRFEATNFDFNPAGTQLETLDLSANASVAGANITFTAVPQGAMGDGKVNVGYIKAGTIDLGRIALPGDLGKIDVGDNGDRPALKSLTVNSLGAQGTGTGAPNLVTNIRGGVGNLHVLGDIDEAFVVLSDVGGRPGSGGVGKLTVGGSLLGGMANDTGAISFTGTISKASIGSLQGADGNRSGSLIGSNQTLSKIKKMTVTGVTVGLAQVGVAGGDGTDSGEISALSISSLKIGALVKGGDGGRSGFIQAAHLGKMLVDGDLQGGAGFFSGEVFAGDIRALHVTGDVIGGTAGTVVMGQATDGHSGVIEAVRARTIVIDGSLLGGNYVNDMQTAANSGSVSIQNGLRSLAIGENVTGGTGNSSGNIFAGESLRTAKIGGDFTGGDSSATRMVVNSGYFQAAQISRVSIGGNFESGTNGGAGIDSSGAIRAEHSIGSIHIGGNIVGNATNPALITAVGVENLPGRAKVDLAIGSITVDGSVTRAGFLAGYGTDTSTNLLGKPLNADASIGTVRIGAAASALNIVAGVQATDGKFGNADDARISGVGTIDRLDVISRISKVVINGAATGSGVGTESFGIVSQFVRSVTVGGIGLGLQGGASNDLPPGLVIGSANFHALEII